MIFEKKGIFRYKIIYFEIKQHQRQIEKNKMEAYFSSCKMYS